MLIIYAHPNKDGHCGQILKSIQNNLTKNKIEFKLLDLYEMNYNPILKNSEHYTSGHYEISEENKNIQTLIKNENRFIFIYPTWWNNMPAILKGFVDRVFVSNFSYKFVHGIPCGLLKGRVTVFTSTGASRFSYSFFLGRRSLKVLAKDTLNFCGFKTRCFVINNSTKLNDQQIKKIDKAVKYGLKYLSN